MKKAVLPAILFLLVIAVALFLIHPRLQPEQKNDQKTAPLPPQQISLFHYFSGPLSGGMKEMIEDIEQGSLAVQAFCSADLPVWLSFCSSRNEVSDTTEAFAILKTCWQGTLGAYAHPGRFVMRS